MIKQRLNSAMIRIDWPLPRKTIQLLAFLQLLTSLLSIIIQIFLISEGDEVNVKFLGIGIWSGVFFAITSVLGLITAQRPTKCGVVSFLVTSILSACLCVPLLQVSIGGLHDNEDCDFGNYNCKNSDDGMFGVRSRTLPQVQLSGGNSSNEGNVLALNPRTGDFGPVCGDSWDIDEALVVCRQLGYSDVEDAFDVTSFDDVTETIFSMVDVQCSGNETQLEDCIYLDGPECPSGEVAGVICIDEQAATTAEPPVPTTRPPIQPREVYLIGGASTHQGNVFAYNSHTGIEGPVCHTEWDNNDANVVCRQLGFVGALGSFHGSRYGDVSRPFSYKGVKCNGNEKRLEDCARLSHGDCDADSGAGVYCFQHPTPEVNLVGGVVGGNTGNVFATNPSTGVYGPVCSINWSEQNADVVCKQLGFLSSRRFSIATYPDGAKNFSYTDVDCTGKEYKLEQCLYSSEECKSDFVISLTCNSHSFTTPTTTTTRTTPYPTTTTATYEPVSLRGDLLTIIQILIALIVAVLSIASSILMCRTLCSANQIHQRNPQGIDPIYPGLPMEGRPHQGYPYSVHPQPPPKYEMLDFPIQE